MRKKIIIALVTIVVIVALVAGGITAYLTHQKNSLEAEVTSVDFLSWYYGGDEMSSYGMVTNDFNQDVYLLDNQTVEEIFVAEGQEVKAGDPLMSYDMTLSKIQVEMQQLEIQNIDNRIILAKRELEKLKKETPIPESTVDPEPTPGPTDPAQIDTATGAFHYLQKDINLELVKSAGTGTAADPYIIRCMPDCYVTGSFFNDLAFSAGLVFVRLQIINPTTGADVEDQYWDVSSQQFGGMTLNESDQWMVATRELVTEDDPYTDIQDDPGTDVQEPEAPKGYTAKELQAAIQQAEKQVKDLDLQKRKAALQLEQLQKLTDDGVVLATVDGIVKTLGDPENPPTDGSAFMTVAGSEGLYVSGTISELLLEKVQVGQVVYANSWQSGTSFEATIQEISQYPAENSNSWSEGNTNVSYYPFVAYIANSEGLQNGEYVDLTMTANYNEDEASALYIEKAYVREEDGKSYVLMADENDRLKKQYVETGRTIYGSAIEIRSGLSRDARIAFPYGKAAKEGVKVKDASSGMYY